MGFFGFLGKVIKGGLKIASVVPGLNIGASALKFGTGLAGKLVGRKTPTSLAAIIAARRAGSTMPTLLEAPGLVNKLSAVMPGGAVLSAQVSGGGGLARGPGLKRKKKRAGGHIIKRARAHAGGRRRLTRAQLRAGFGGKRRMRG